MKDVKINAHNLIIRIKYSSELVSVGMPKILNALHAIHNSFEAISSNDLLQMRKNLENFVESSDIEQDLRDDYPNKLNSFKNEIAILCSKLV